MGIFPKKVIRKFGPRNFFCVPQTLCQVSAYGLESSLDNKSLPVPKDKQIYKYNSTGDAAIQEAPIETI